MQQKKSPVRGGKEPNSITNNGRKKRIGRRNAAQWTCYRITERVKRSDCQPGTLRLLNSGKRGAQVNSEATTRTEALGPVDVSVLYSVRSLEISNSGGAKGWKLLECRPKLYDLPPRIDEMYSSLTSDLLGLASEGRDYFHDMFVQNLYHSRLTTILLNPVGIRIVSDWLRVKRN